MRSHHTQLARGCNAAQRGQADIKRDHIRLQRCSLMDGVNAICSFTDDHHLRQSLQEGTERAAEPLVVLDDEYSTKGHQIRCIIDGERVPGEPVIDAHRLNDLTSRSAILLEDPD